MNAVSSAGASEPNGRFVWRTKEKAACGPTNSRRTGVWRTDWDWPYDVLEINALRVSRINL